MIPALGGPQRIIFAVEGTKLLQTVRIIEVLANGPLALV